MANPKSTQDTKTRPATKPAETKSTAPGALSIRAVPEQGFWRGGIKWGPEAKTVPLSDLTLSQIKAIKAEGAKKRGKLIVQEIAPSAEKATG